MVYSLSPSPGSYDYTSTGTSYQLTGWLSNGMFQVSAGSTQDPTSFAGVTGNLIALLLQYYALHHSWPCSWAPYCYADLGLDPSQYASPIGNVIYKVGGSTVSARPAPGYVMTVTDVNGQQRVLTNSLNWVLWYDATTGNWYYHTTDPGNQIDISTLTITPAAG